MDRTRIAQVVSNLLDNALFHTPSGGVVTISAQEINEAVLVNMVDTGRASRQTTWIYCLTAFTAPTLLVRDQQAGLD